MKAYIAWADPNVFGLGFSIWNDPDAELGVTLFIGPLTIEVTLIEAAPTAAEGEEDHE